jgi:hypothetical protein
VFEKTVSGVLSLIERERRGKKRDFNKRKKLMLLFVSGEEVPRALIASLLRMLAALGL